MKKLILLFAALLFSATAYAEPIKGYFFSEVPFQYESWTWANGQWHVERGPWIGLRTVIPILPGHILQLKEGLLWDGMMESSASEGKLGFGPVGNCLSVLLKVDAEEASLSFEYTIKNWWVNDTTYGYEYMVCPNAIVQNMKVTVEWRLF